LVLFFGGKLFWQQVGFGTRRHGNLAEFNNSGLFSAEDVFQRKTFGAVSAAT
jgi:hypothetical protein